MDTGLGFGGANYGQGTHGKGVMQSFADTDATTSVSSFGVAIWEATQSQINATASLTDFGGLSKGGTALISASTIMQDRPVFQWAGFGSDSPSIEVLTYGYISWDGQNVSDTTWTPFQVD